MRQAIKFLQEVRAEFRNISWPKKEALFELTFVVISISIIISLILGGFDYLFTQSIAYLSQSSQSNNKQNLVVPTGTVTTATPSAKANFPTIPVKSVIKN